MAGAECPCVIVSLQRYCSNLAQLAHPGKSQCVCEWVKGNSKSLAEEFTEGHSVCTATKEGGHITNSEWQQESRTKEVQVIRTSGESSFSK